MISLFLGLLISIALFLFNLVLRFVITALGTTLKVLTKKLESLVSKSDLVTKSADSVRKLGSLTAKTAQLGVRAAILSVKLLLSVLRVLSLVLTFIFSSIFTILLFIVLPLCLLTISLFMSIATTVSTIDLDTSGRTLSYTSNAFISAYSYDSIDWSQDFSRKLDVIEATNGKNDRDVLEWIIICMNTQQSISDARLPIEGYCVGNIVVESGSSANFMGGASGSPTTDYTLRNANEGVEWMYASGDESGRGYPTADGAFQIITPSWVKYNPLYGSYSSQLEPEITPDTDWHIMRHYCPSVAYGTLVKYMGAVYGTGYEFKNTEGKSAISHAFEFIEKLIDTADDYATEVVFFSILESLFYRCNNHNLILPYMGNKSKEFFLNLNK